LREALVRGEFYVEYQPKVSLVTDRTVGVEALIRWMHPERGLIAPLDFIPLAEESGIIVQIGAWVLEQVCRDAMRWRTALPGGQPLMVAVNVSPRQFESDLAETFGGIIGRSGIDPATVCLEVTESMVMQDAELAIATLRELKSLGLSISVDDFGTGFSSLAYLKRFPLDELKIDKSFVDGLGHDYEATAIVAAVMGMAHALDLRVVAEGVETADQVVRLRTLGCDEAQGFFYARPGPAMDIDARLVAEARAHVGGSRHPERKSAESAHIGKILVVDDADDVRQLARSSLAAVGFEVREAATGEDAVTMARHLKPDCLVLDVNLPGMSGFDVCRILRDDPANQRTTIVILTGDAGPSEKVMAFSLEADDYMVKPFSPRDLVSRVTAAIRRRGEMFASTPQ
jgi:EAL domain-containing protein (putative c-di-GMP-specific phosphodiesterase class I)/ActR/RegA family two-component response regulator